MRFHALLIYPAIGIATGIFLSLISANILPKKYEAAFVAAAPQDSSKSIDLPIDLPFTSDVLSGLGSGSGEGKANYNRFLATLSGRDLATDIAQDPKLMHEIFASQWDSKNKIWRAPSGLASALSRTVKSMYGMSPWQKPNAESVMRYLDSSMSVLPMRKGLFHKVSISDKSPELALALTRRILVSADDILRQKDIKDAAFNIYFLQEKLITSNLSETRASISKSLSIELLKQMRLKNPRPYTLEVFSSPALTVRPVFPNPLMMLLFGILGGGILGLIVAYIRLPKKIGMQSSEDIADAKSR
jgi:hypothetical protein